MISKLKYLYLLSLYKYGDQIGRTFEGGGPDSITYEEAMKGPKRFPNGTDETDIAMLAEDFFSSRKSFVTRDANDWLSFLAKNHSASEYGRTWRDHFATIDYARKENKEKLIVCRNASKDRNSAANGCIGLLFPIAFNVRKSDAAVLVAGLSHAGGLDVVRLLVNAYLEFFACDNISLDGLDTSVRCFCNIHKKVNYNLTPLIDHCVLAAIECAKQDTIEDAVRFAISKGGDADSYLSLGLLLWGMKKSASM